MNKAVFQIVSDQPPRNKVTLLNRLDIVKVDGKRYLEQTILYGPGGSQDSDEYTKWPNDGKMLVGHPITSLVSGVWTVVDGSPMTLTVRQPLGLLRSLWKRLCWYFYYPSRMTAMEIS